VKRKKLVFQLVLFYCGLLCERLFRQLVVFWLGFCRGNSVVPKTRAGDKFVRSAGLEIPTWLACGWNIEIVLVCSA